MDDHIYIIEVRYLFRDTPDPCSLSRSPCQSGHLMSTCGEKGAEVLAQKSRRSRNREVELLSTESLMKHDIVAHHLMTIMEELSESVTYRLSPTDFTEESERELIFNRVD